MQNSNGGQTTDTCRPMRPWWPTRAVTQSAMRPSRESRFGHDFSGLASHADGRDASAALPIERSLELDPAMFLKPMSAPAVRETEKCEEFPGGSTDCEVDNTGTPTAKVNSKVTETNPCTRPCVEKHEAVHVKQMKTLCRELRECYLAADKGKRPSSDCMSMAIFGMKSRECEAYNVSAPCMAERLKTATACQSKENKAYGTRKLASETCFRKANCS
jgi:hypothetical protein